MQKSQTRPPSPHAFPTVFNELALVENEDTVAVKNLDKQEPHTTKYATTRSQSYNAFCVQDFHGIGQHAR